MSRLARAGSWWWRERHVADLHGRLGLEHGGFGERQQPAGDHLERRALRGRRERRHDLDFRERPVLDAAGIGRLREPARVAYGANWFVTVGEAGVKFSSSDGLTWTPQTRAPSDLYGLIYAGDRFVAVGNAGLILTSRDGLTWSNAVSGTSSRLQGVTWDGRQFIVTGRNGTILNSSNGVDWTSQTCGSNYWEAVGYGNGIYVTADPAGLSPSQPTALTGLSFQRFLAPPRWR